MINFEFIQELEGNSCTGYVPDIENSNSGVTIGCGFDLGARSKDEIRSAFETSLADKLLPYATLKKHDAQQALDIQPLTLDEEDVAEINKFGKQQAIDRLVEQWNSEPGIEVEFYALPESCQTVVASVAFQYGTLKTRTPNFWRQVTSGDWHSALGNLRGFGDRYPSRRNKEADLLESWLESV